MEKNEFFDIIRKKFFTEKFLWLNMFVLFSIVFIPIILIGFEETSKACYKQGFMCFPSLTLIFGIISYGIGIVTVIILGFVELAKKKVIIEKVDTGYEQQHNLEAGRLLKIYSVIIFIFLYKIIIHAETLIDFLTGNNVQYESGFFIIELLIIVIMCIFSYKNKRKWNTQLIANKKFINSLNKSMASLVVWSVIDIVCILIL